MPVSNWMVVLATGLVPLIMGFLWYGPLFGKAWMKAADMDQEKMKGANMAVIFGLALIFGLMLATALVPVVIHQMGLFSLLQVPAFKTAGSPEATAYGDIMAKYGTNFRTFKHGAFHGAMAGLFMFLPIMGTNALFERKGWTYILLNVGFWTVCAMIMGGIISAWA